MTSWLAVANLFEALPRDPGARLHTANDRGGIGAKGCGEAGAIAAPAAVMSAILDALAPLGVGDIEMPATPERVWRAIREAKGGRSPATAGP